jgi:hypothetical protein
MDAEELIARVNDLQPRLIAQLQKASASQQLAHAFLFTGPAGRGQTLVADWLACVRISMKMDNLMVLAINVNELPIMNTLT